jgi:hypothetical protein
MFLRDEATPIEVAVLFFLIAAVFGLLVNIPVRYAGFIAKDLKDQLSILRGPMEDAVIPNDTLPEIATAQTDAEVAILIASQKWNFIRSVLLVFGFAAEVLP